MVKRKYRSLTEALIDALNETDVPLRQVERETGVKRQSIMKFVRGEQSLRLDIGDKLAAYFGLEVHRTGKRKAK